MDDTNDEPQREKKPYVKPDIQQVSLRPDEAVLGRITALTSEGKLSASIGEDYNIRAVREERPEDERAEDRPSA